MHYMPGDRVIDLVTENVARVDTIHPDGTLDIQFNTAPELLHARHPQQLRFDRATPQETLDAMITQRLNALTALAKQLDGLRPLLPDMDKGQRLYTAARHVQQAADDLHTLQQLTPSRDRGRD